MKKDEEGRRKQGVPSLMQTGEETAPGKGREAFSLAQAASLLSKVDVLSHLSTIPLNGYTWDCFIYRELKLDLRSNSGST